LPEQRRVIANSDTAGMGIHSDLTHTGQGEKPALRGSRLLRAAAKCVGPHANRSPDLIGGWIGSLETAPNSRRGTQDLGGMLNDMQMGTQTIRNRVVLL